MAGPQTDNSGQIQRRAEKPGRALADLVNGMKGKIAEALPKHITPDRMARVCLTALTTNNDLARSDPSSFLSCVLQASQLGLEVNSPLGLAYLIPRKDKSGNFYTTLQIGYQGMLDLARRAGQIVSIEAEVVYAGDHFVHRKGDNPLIEHEPRGEDSPEKITHAYAIARLKDGGIQREVITRKQIDKSRALGARSGPWSTHYAEMARKTVIRRLYKLLPKSAEVAYAMELDERADLERDRAQAGAFSPEVQEILASTGHKLPADTEAEVLDVAEVPDAVPAGEGGAS